LKPVQARLADINAAGIDVVVISADDVKASSTYVSDNGFSFPVACNLTVDMMRLLGLYVSSPKGYVDQEHMFSEPGYFLITPENVIRYMAIASSPFGGRVDVDAILMGFGWNKAKALESPEFKDYIWGNK
jgi:peroxiredoxin